MKKLSLVSFFLLFTVLFAFSQPENQEEIDYLLFLPNSGSRFVDEAQAAIKLDNLAKYLLEKDLTLGQIYVFGYTAFVANDIDSVDLSRERALFVINELQRRGVSRNLFSDPVGYGSVDLWGGNTNEEDRSPNRRVRVTLDGDIVTPETIKESEPEITISSADDREPVRQETKTKKSGVKLPLWPFLLLHFLVLIGIILFILSRRKKSPAAKPAEPVKAEPAKIEPVKAEPVKAEPLKAETVKAEPAKDAPVTAPEMITRTTVKLDEEIRQRAYELFLERGSQHGNMAGDWYSAIFDVCAKYESAGYRIYSEGEHWWAS
jgi:hypothetical protein